MTESLLERTLKSALLAGAGFAILAGSAYAQDTAPAAEPVAEEADTTASVGSEEQIVTGSRIRRDFTSNSPISTVNSETIELSGKQSIEQLLNTLPQVVPGLTSSSNNPSLNGIAEVDLRGLGSQRTLVLVNGRRAPASDVRGLTDVGLIPAALIDRVEVVTGGAAAVYGADAVSGVVNFILKKNFTGIQFNAGYGVSEEGDAQEASSSLTIGGEFANGRGHLTAFASYTNRHAVGAHQRDFTATPISVLLEYDTMGTAATGDDVLLRGITTYNPADQNAGTNRRIAVFAAGGSATSSKSGITFASGNAPTAYSAIPGFGGYFANTFGSVNSDCNSATPNVAVNAGGIFVDSTGRPIPTQGCPVSTGYMSPPGSGLSTRYNFSPDNYLILPAERVSGAFFGEYELIEGGDLTAFIEATYTQSTVSQMLAPTPGTGFTVTPRYADGTYNPFITPELRAILDSRADPDGAFTLNRRFNEVGNRIGTVDQSQVAFTTGLKGDLGSAANLAWEVYYQFSRVTVNTTLFNNVNRTAVQQGLAGCQVTPALAVLPGCVPINIFGEGTLNAQQAAFVRLNARTFSELERNSIAAILTGEAFELPAGPVGFAVGLEYRSEAAKFLVDDAQRTGNIIGFNATKDIIGSYDVYEFFGEVDVPLVKNVELIHYLGFEGGIRWSDYNTGAGTTFTWKAGAEYAPFKWLRFRGVYNEAVRAPTAFELFQAGDQGFPSYTDPCNATLAGRPTAFCIAQGVPVAEMPTFAQTNSQVQAFSFGETNLTPEEAETYTIGVVFSPDEEILPWGRLSLSVDYFNIEITNLIGTRGAQTVISSCYTNLGATPQSALDCSNITRDPNTGQISAVNTGRLNSASIFKTSGIDVQVQYLLPLDVISDDLPGTLSFALLYSWLESYESGGAEYRGTTDGLATLPIHKVNLATTYSVDDWAFRLNWSHISGVRQYYFGDTYGVPNMDVGAYDIFDLSVRYAVTENVEITGIVNNLFDVSAPVLADSYFGQSSANTDASSYDVIGRYYRLALTFRM